MTIRILLADNHAGMRESLRALIERQSDMAVVAVAENGHSVVQLAESCKPEVVVMDINMPDIKGIDAARRLLAGSPGIKILALSIYANRQLADQMIAAGVLGYLLKERAFEELDRAIHSVAASHVYICPGMEKNGAATTV